MRFLQFAVAMVIAFSAKSAAALDFVGGDEASVTSGRTCVDLATAIVNSNWSAISESPSTLSPEKRVALLALVKTWPALDEAAGAQLYANFNYQNTVDVAYVLIFMKSDETPVFLRCLSTKHAGKWRMPSFKFNSDIDRLGLPGSTGIPIADDDSSTQQK
jgi:hypothetical protein